ncbi:hypothetical protein NLU13_4824 [Sarocladium strictum]|uniref:Lysine-specific metallo-endopeptidase domain-containing protein n=1 Tax=Sarocladium strictum TaxID=5046 RepID=A0AA39GJY5_SARSR|nr:hypothetical protein NLU13_4824 [Sarocladium strictum]
MKPSAILLWGLSTLSSTGHAVKTVGQIFNVDLTTSANGGCAQNPGEQVLNQEVMDCYTLAQAGVDLLNSFNSGDDAAKRLVDSLFRMGKTPTSDAREKAMILATYTSVSNLLSNGPSGTPARLFCGSGWLSRVRNNQVLTIQSPALDINGNPIKTINGQPATLQDVYKKQWKNWINGGLVPYWAEVYNAYVMDNAFRSPLDTYCSQPSVRAATQAQTSPPSITLCLRAFSTPKKTLSPPPSIKTATVSVINTGRSLSSITRLQVLLERLAPLTLYHELFHLVLTPAASPDTTYDVAAMIDANANPQFYSALLATNPETYVAASYAWWLFQQTGAEFFTGYASSP